MGTVPYKVVFIDIEEPLIVNASEIVETDTGFVVFYDDANVKIASIPKDKVRYVKKVNNGK
ncbi:MAG: hypothetical protein F4X55_02925 [Candidatus Dadabacteria bacterium]|nr:hypothetical protein [Candidatus Dadabacteria bacterium]